MLKLDDLFLENIPDIPYNIELHTYREYCKKNRKKGKNKLIYQLIHKTIPLEKNKQEILDKILSDCESIYRSLMPLYKVGIHFSLALAGGSVRDLLLDKEDKIKDLDIILSINTDYSFTIPSSLDLFNELGFDTKKYAWTESVSVKTIKTKHVFRHGYKKYTMTINDKIYEIIKFLLSKNQSFENCFPPFKTDSEEIIKKQLENMPTESEYIARNLKGVLKINTPQLNYPIDILITNTSITAFIELFDFNICKASFLLVDKVATYQKYMHFPKNPKQLLNRYMPNTLFLEDVSSKCITLDSENRNPGDIERSLASHLERIRNKFPDFNLNLFVDEKDPSYKEKQIIINHYHLSKKLLSTPVKKNQNITKI